MKIQLPKFLFLLLLMAATTSLVAAESKPKLAVLTAGMSKMADNYAFSEQLGSWLNEASDDAFELASQSDGMMYDKHVHVQGIYSAADSSGQPATGYLLMEWGAVMDVPYVCLATVRQLGSDEYAFLARLVRVKENLECTGGYTAASVTDAQELAAAAAALSDQLLKGGSCHRPVMDDAAYAELMVHFPILWARVDTLQADISAHLSDTLSNPHRVTAAQLGLGNVDDTRDADKPVSAAQRLAIDSAKAAADTVQAHLTAAIAALQAEITALQTNIATLQAHVSDTTSNPHRVTAAQLAPGEGQLAIEPKMVFVQGGTFTMGCVSGRDGDSCSRSSELPAHNVTLSSFKIGKYEVTQGEWKAMMGGYPNSSLNKNDNYPVNDVSWDDAQAYIDSLNKLTGKNYRLPTEAEWEYAARGGISSNGYQFSGSDIIEDVAWYSGNSNRTTHQVGTKAANELGIYDMSGNVWEWCSDWYGAYSSDAATNPQCPGSGTTHLLRGGCWSPNATFSRVAYRVHYTSSDHFTHFGFRVVLP